MIRNFEPRRKQDEVMENEKEEVGQRDGDAMKSLEKQTHDSKRDGYSR